MQARELRFKNTAETIGSLNTSDVTADYAVDVNTAVLFHFSEGSGLVTKNEVSGVNSVFGFSGGHYPTWVNNINVTTSLADNNQIDFSLHPNPVLNGKFSIQANTNETIKRVELFNVLGKSVKSLDFNNRKNQIDVSVENLNTGIYIVKTETENGIGTQKLIIN